MTPEEKDARVARAMAMHAKGFNCAQCVACAAADLVSLDEDEVFRLMEGFGGGMGGFNQTCGAISGGVALLGYANSSGIVGPISKAETYVLSKSLVDRFREMNGSTFCDDRKGESGGPVLRSCDGCIEDGLRLTIDILERIS